MVFMVIFALAGLVVGWLKLEYKDELSDYAMGVFMSVIFGFFGLLLGFGISVGVGAALPKEYVLDKQMELVAIQDTSGIQGRFFLGAGTIESKFYYVFYQRERNGIRFGNVPAENAVVYEENRDDGLIKEYDKRFMAGWHDFFGATWGERYDIFIPEGSILHEFNLDLK